MSDQSDLISQDADTLDFWATGKKQRLHNYLCWLVFEGQRAGVDYLNEPFHKKHIENRFDFYKD